MDWGDRGGRKGPAVCGGGGGGGGGGGQGGERMGPSGGRGERVGYFVCLCRGSEEKEGRRGTGLAFLCVSHRPPSLNFPPCSGGGCVAPASRVPAGPQVPYWPLLRGKPGGESALSGPVQIQIQILSSFLMARSPPWLALFLFHPIGFQIQIQTLW